jgi:aminoglycoside 3-N-acetyltransferase
MNMKTAIKTRVHALRRGYQRIRHAFDEKALLDGLRQIGVARGDTILVHSSIDAFTGFQGKPTDVLQVLREAIGEAGTLMMPAIPFQGTAVDYARSGVVFDVQRTPARVGLLPELLRRTPGAMRSLHPTHSVVAVGPGAAALIAGHIECETPCAAGSPYYRLLDVGGKSVFLGVGIETMTFFHAIEAMVESRMPFSPFTAGKFELSYRDADGVVRTMQSRLFDPAVSRRRSLGRLAAELRRSGCWHEARIGNLVMSAVLASDARSAVETMADRGEYCYDA